MCTCKYMLPLWLFVLVLVAITGIMAYGLCREQYQSFEDFNEQECNNMSLTETEAWLRGCKAKETDPSTLTADQLNVWNDLLPKSDKMGKCRQKKPFKQIPIQHGLRNNLCYPMEVPSKVLFQGIGWERMYTPIGHKFWFQWLPLGDNKVTAIQLKPGTMAFIRTESGRVFSADYGSVKGSVKGRIVQGYWHFLKTPGKNTLDRVIGIKICVGKRGFNRCSV